VLNENEVCSFLIQYGQIALGGGALIKKSGKYVNKNIGYV
jgi:hypothetical protein